MRPRVERLDAFGYLDPCGEVVRLVVQWGGAIRYVSIDAMHKPAENVRLAEALADALRRSSAT